MRGVAPPGPRGAEWEGGARPVTQMMSIFCFLLIFVLEFSHVIKVSLRSFSGMSFGFLSFEAYKFFFFFNFDLFSLTSCSCTVLSNKSLPSS